MTKRILLSAVVASALATQALATNGSHLIAVGPKTMSMGGAGIAMANGPESMVANPAMIASIEGTEISGNLNFFQGNPTFEFTGNTEAESDSPLSVIPAISAVYSITKDINIGLGVFGYGGAGVDYSGEATGPLGFKTALQVMDIVVPVSYKIDSVTVGVSAVMKYGSLAVDYDMTGFPGGGPVGDDKATTSTGIGYAIGLAYEPMKDLNLGLNYRSKVEMNYGSEFSDASAPFVAFGIFPANFDNRLDEPAEWGAGLAYKLGANTFALDYKMIQWSDADGYSSFNWQDQTVIAMGYEYNGGSWAARVGYNLSTSPIEETAGGSVSDTAGAVNLFSLGGFPALSDSSITAGAGYSVNKDFDINLAVEYSPEASQKYDTTALNVTTTGAGVPISDSVSASLNTLSISIGADYRF